ncbi:hypothetical protein EDD11_007526 [Mortierella claussenii]|nr:hypothetical protein EDD11_007526 [Mortierella claussenii]
MHSVARTVKSGSPLSRRAIPRPTGGKHLVLLLQPTKAAASVQKCTLSTGPLAAAYTSSTSLCRSGATHTSTLWTRRFYSIQSEAPVSSSSSAATTTVPELEQLLQKNDYAGFQQACLHATTHSGKTSKSLYHFLLKTLADNPKAFSPLTTATITTATTESTIADAKNGLSFDPLNSALSILTDMSREANMGKIELQPDRDTVQLLLKVAGSQGAISFSTHREYSKSVRVLVDAIRHGRLPVVMSSDQWELPDSNAALDQELWKQMFDCIQAVTTAADGASRPKASRTEMAMMNFVLADQLSKTVDVEMDEQLWCHVVKAFENYGSAELINNLLPKIPLDSHTSSEFYSVIAKALANCGSVKRASEIMHTLSHTRQSLPSIAPLVALSRQHAKLGHFEAIRYDIKLWAAKGQCSAVNDSLLKDIHRSMLAAIAVALDRMVDAISSTLKDRQMNTLPHDVLPGLLTPPQLTAIQFEETRYLKWLSRISMDAIPEDELTAQDYDSVVLLKTRLNLLQPLKCTLHEAISIPLTSMRRRNLRPLKSTYMTAMETVARTRQYGAKRESGEGAQWVMRLFEAMVSQGGYAAHSPSDFVPLLESCFGISTYSPFAASQWMYSNQLYPVSRHALDAVEVKMQQRLVKNRFDPIKYMHAYKSGKSRWMASTQQEIHMGSSDLIQVHDSTTMATVLAGLAQGDEMEEVLKRWEELPLHGITRDAKLYQTMIGASQVQDKLARYVLRVVRHQMLKEQPAVAMTPQIFTGLLNCCIRAQDVNSARSVIEQYSTSGEIQKTAEWYVPMVRTCLMLEEMEEEGLHLLEEMRTKRMKMDGSSGAFYEFLMDYFVMKRMNYEAGREIFKSFVMSEHAQLQELIKARQLEQQHQDSQETTIESNRRTWFTSDWALTSQAQRLEMPVVHPVERVEISQTTASMLNLLALSHLRERAQLLEQEKRSGLVPSAADRFKDAQAVIHYMAEGVHLQSTSSESEAGFKNASQDSAWMNDSTIPGDSSLGEVRSSTTPTSTEEAPSTLSMSPRFVENSPSTEVAERKVPPPIPMQINLNKYVLGEYIDTCIREGTEEMLKEAKWALFEVMPGVIGKANMAQDAQRLKQALLSAQNRLNPAATATSVNSIEDYVQPQHGGAEM